ncbi:MAG: sn-glycerol-3-phosphate ABC transporter ATP-binding protein UgpC [Phycisphaerales bacterium]|nr:sn-glycerol-3-phosphate ABC transporter ATP-binding protein UgpC [Phycisphaerales bacterium]
MAQVSLSNVRKIYPGGFEAVRGFSLDIADGEFVVLVGPSGCGKTTTLRLVAGLEDISEGQVSIGGRVVNEVHPKDRDIAMVFQKYALYPHMSAYKNMAFALKLRKVPKPEIDSRVRAAAAMLGIEELLDRKPGKMSGGQQQRVAVGRAIVRNPKAFLFDEPLSNLDAKLRVTTRAELKALHQRLKTTTIYVTHDQEEAMTLGDRIVVMHKGQIQQADSPLEVYRHPANRFVASFIGTPPMNFLEGELVQEGSAVVFIEHTANGATGAGLRIPLTAEQSAKVRMRTGQAITLGLRPQMLREASPGARDRFEAGPVVSLEVRVVEPLGETMDVFATTPGGHKVVARVPAKQSLIPAGVHNFVVDMTQAHLFEPGELGVNLLLDR